MPNPFMIAAAVTLVAAAIGIYLLMPAKKKRKKGTFVSSGPILSGKQIEIYEQIQATLGSAYKIFPKIPIDEIIAQDPRTPEKERVDPSVQLDRKTVDFIIARTDTMEIICCIMVPRTLAVDQAVIADRQLKQALSSADIPLVHIKPSTQLTKEEIYKRLKHVIENPELQGNQSDDYQEEEEDEGNIEPTIPIRQ